MRLGELLVNCFEFYRRFEFERGAISVRSGQPIGKCFYIWKNTAMLLTSQ